jgi:hypothetical protein
MPKRTGNSSVNSSIRQNTESTNEGFGALLAAQEASLGELVSIKALLELSKDQEKNKAMTSGNADLADIQDKILSTLEDQLTTTKRRAKQQEDYEREWRIESAHIADMAKLMDTQGSVFQQMGESFKQKKEGFKEKYGGGLGGGLGRTIMGAVNVGGIFNKSIEKSKFREKQRALGGDASNENAEQAYKASRDIKAHDAEIEKFKKTTGLNDEQIRSTKRGSEMMERRNVLTDAYSATDKATHVFDPTIRGREVTPEGAKTPTQTAADSMQNREAQIEGAKSQEQMNELFKKIEENTRGEKGGAEKIKPEKVSGSGGGIMDMITSLLGDGLVKSLKTMFSPKNILKSLGKVFAIGMIVGALFEGIMDGFDEFMESGDIGKALIAGLAGIVDFLTFGLFDKDAIKEVIGDMAGWINDHVVKPFVDFAVSLKDSFLALVESIGIPEIKFKIPVIGKEVAIGPFYPFKGASSGGKSPEAPAPTAATTVEQKSADNAGAALPEKQSAGTTVVNAPVSNNTTQNQNIRAPIRNQDSSATRYVDSRLRQA